MKKVFVDSGYWIALINPRDQFHGLARSTMRGLGPAFLLTSEMVLAELLDYYCESGPFLRESAARLADALYSAPNTRVITQSNSLFRSAVALYLDRGDKKVERNGLRLISNHGGRKRA
jgi:predicted nucleic acid-binding protein